jgi:hypothetical protein
MYVLMRIRRRAAAEETQWFMRSNLMPGAAGDEDGVAHCDFARFTIEFHQAAAFKDEVELLRKFVEMPLGGGAGGEAGLSQALQFHWGVRAVKDAPDGGAILGCEWLLGGKRVDCHGGCGIVRAPCVSRKQQRP